MKNIHKKNPHLFMRIYFTENLAINILIADIKQ